MEKRPDRLSQIAKIFGIGTFKLHAPSFRLRSQKPQKPRISKKAFFNKVRPNRRHG